MKWLEWLKWLKWLNSKTTTIIILSLNLYMITMPLSSVTQAKPTPTPTHTNSYFTNTNNFINSSTYIKDFGHKRKLFLLVESDIKNGKIHTFKKYQPLLKNYPLFPYLEYELLVKKINHVTLKDLEQFEKKYADSVLSKKLRNIWLKAKAKDHNWHEFVRGYKYNNNEDIEFKCNFIYAHFKIHNDTSILNQVTPIWLNGNSQPKACDKTFHIWEQSQFKTRSLVWQRIKLAFEKNNISLVKHLSKSLSAKENQLVALWIKAYNNPYIILKQKHLFIKKSPIIQEIITTSLIKIANKEPLQASSLWRKLSKHHNFTKHQLAIVMRSIAINLAKIQHPEAKVWLQKIPPRYINQQVINSRFKLALIANDWNSIHDLYLSLPTELAKSEKWQYWYARSLEMLGYHTESQAILTNIATERSYYGFLSSLRILKPFSFKDQVLTITNNEIKYISSYNSIQRAYELHFIGKTIQGYQEWQHAIQNISEKERQIAAKFAMELGLPNWSITALAHANNKNNLSLRFPKTYAKYILKEAKKNYIDPALIFAITRQESAFITHAKSPAGALGLMQLLPSTAKIVANKIREPLHHHCELLKADKNILLGSKYLRMMLDKYQNNVVLASAAYNAGPARIQDWLPKHDMSADKWIETIPFQETRNYVQNVLAYTVIYQQLLGKKPNLNYHMPVIIGNLHLNNLNN